MLHSSDAADDDGSIRFDFGTGSTDLNGRSFEEHVVEHGDEICVFGTFSAARGGIVSDSDNPLFQPARLRRGSFDSLMRGLAWGVLGCALGVLVFGGFAAAGAWIFFNFGPVFF